MQEKSTSSLREAQGLTMDISGHANPLGNFKYVSIFGNSLYELTFQKHQGHHYTCTCCEISAPLCNLYFSVLYNSHSFSVLQKIIKILQFVQYRNSLNFLICNFLYRWHKIPPILYICIFSTGLPHLTWKTQGIRKIVKISRNLNSDRKNLENSGKT